MANILLERGCNHHTCTNYSGALQSILDAVLSSVSSSRDVVALASAATRELAETLESHRGRSPVGLVTSRRRMSRTPLSICNGNTSGNNSSTIACPRRLSGQGAPPEPTSLGTTGEILSRPTWRTRMASNDGYTSAGARRSGPTCNTPPVVMSNSRKAMAMTNNAIAGVMWHSGFVAIGPT